MGRPRTKPVDNSPIAPGRDDARMRGVAINGSTELLARLVQHHNIDALIYQDEPTRRRPLR